MHNFRELKIWQRSMDFVVEIYNITKDFPPEERYGLVSQQRRCAVSIPSNISEGAGRATNAQFKYFLEISMGSCNELITQLELSYRLQYISVDNKNKLIEEATQIYKMILGFYNTFQ
ncbi:four helix bundle protein [soil metagenome]